ncbi:MAG: response regulator [Candidatus Omnitrophica bacterium]|nr:response regulator [Candidatus Omnitrophota bacterium]
MFGLFDKFNHKSGQQLSPNSVLVIEDSQAQRLFIQKVLQKRDFEVVTAENSQQGVALAKQRSWDLIILDYFLPDSNGLEVCRILKGNPATKNIPIIFLAAAQDGYTPLQCYEAGAYLFLNKPICAKELIRQVELALQDKRGEGEQQDDW